MFLTVGLCAALVNIGSFYVCWKGLHLHSTVAITVSYILSVIFHFIANRRYTFKSHSVCFYLQLPKYLCMILLSYVLTLIVMQCVVSVLHLSPMIGVVASIGATVSTNYLLSRYWVFVFPG